MGASVKIACIGAGYWGMNLVRNFQDLGALSSVCEANAERRALVCKTYPELKLTGSVDEILNDEGIRGVAIATPAETHGALVRRALNADKDVFIEKPLCLSVAEAQDLIDLASERQRILMVGHLLWYHPAVVKLKALIDEGAIGRIQYIYSNRLNLGKIRREENILWSFAPHDISVILGLVGEMPDRVAAHGGNYLHDRIADVTVSLLSFPSGVKAHVFVSWLHPFKEQKLIIVGDRGMTVFDDVAPQDKLKIYHHSILWKNQIPVSSKAEGHAVHFEEIEPLQAECKQFLHSIETRQPPRTDGHEGLQVLTVLQRCQRALEADQAQKSQTLPVEKAPSTFVHDSAIVDEDVQIGQGTTIWHFSHVLKNTRVGKNCRIGQNVVIGPNVDVGNGVKIQNNVSVYEGVTLEDDVFCGPSMVFTNVYNPRSEIARMNELRTTLVKRGATLGANCTILCGVTVGRYAFVGAGAVVLKDIPDYALVVGNPAKTVGWMCACGNRILFNGTNGSGACQSCNRSYLKMEEEVRVAS
jgi:UDP-2-acetamido-3-amino-2,3-dideoxy-glucuronate N-acetyltransferase